MSPVANAHLAASVRAECWTSSRVSPRERAQWKISTSWKNWRIPSNARHSAASGSPRRIRYFRQCGIFETNTRRMYETKNVRPASVSPCCVMWWTMKSVSAAASVPRTVRSARLAAARKSRTASIRTSVSSAVSAWRNVHSSLS